jgi:hypothetical protein
VDIVRAIGKTDPVVIPGASRHRLAGILKAAFASGLLSEQTLTHRLGVLFDQRLVDPDGVVGDLTLRTQIQRGGWRPLASTVAESSRRVIRAHLRRPAAPLILGLDWTSGGEELIIGRDVECDVLLADHSVSRRHARLVCRDGAWIVQDLESTNGTFVNRTQVGRCQLRPGDHLHLGNQLLEID